MQRPIPANLRRLFQLVLAGLALLLLTACPGGAKSGGGWGNAPDFSFVKADGSVGHLYDYAGQPMVVNFWDDG